MKFEFKDKVMTLYFHGELNSGNAQSVEEDALKTLAGQNFSSLVLNFENLKYISSAGLRVVLKLKQQYVNVSIVEASLEVYDVLQMTGFTNIIPVSKALKRISVDGAPVIGEGFFSTVYRIEKDMIIKVFNRVSDPAQIERELKLAKQAFVLGIPTAISFDIVRVGDKLGVRFEMLDCQSLANAFKNEPENYDSYVDRYVALLKKMNTTDCMDPTLPNIKEKYLEKVEAIKDIMDEKYYLKAKKLVEGIDESMNFVHGDCHFKNIMVQGDDLLLIDMDTLSRGESIFELALLRAPYVAFEEDDPGNTEKFLGFKKEFCKKLFEDIVERYYGHKDQAILDKLEILCAIHMIWWNKVNTPDNMARYNGNKNRLMPLLDKYDDLKIK